MDRKLWSIILCMLVYTNSAEAVFGWFTRSESRQAQNVGPDSGSELEESQVTRGGKNNPAEPPVGRDSVTVEPNTPGPSAQVASKPVPNTSAGPGMGTSALGRGMAALSESPLSMAIPGMGMLRMGMSGMGMPGMGMPGMGMPGMGMSGMGMSGMGMSGMGMSGMGMPGMGMSGMGMSGMGMSGMGMPGMGMSGMGMSGMGMPGMGMSGMGMPGMGMSGMGMPGMGMLGMGMSGVGAARMGLGMRLNTDADIGAGFQMCMLHPLSGESEDVTPTPKASGRAMLMGELSNIGLGILGHDMFNTACLSSMVREHASIVMGGSLLASLVGKVFTMSPEDVKENTELAMGMQNGITTAMSLLANPSLVSMNLLTALMMRASSAPGTPKPPLLSKANLAYAMTLALFVAGSFAPLIPVIGPVLALAGPYASSLGIIASFSVQSGLIRGLYRTAKRIFDRLISFFITGNSNVYSRLRTNADRDNYLLTEQKLRELLKDEPPLLVEMRQGANKTMVSQAKALGNLDQVRDYMHCALVSNCHPCMYFGIRALARLSQSNSSEVNSISDGNMQILISLTNSVVLGAGFMTSLMLIPQFKPQIPGLLLALISIGEIKYFAEFFFSLARLQPKEAQGAIALARKGKMEPMAKEQSILSCVFFRLIDEKCQVDCGEQTILRAYKADVNFAIALDIVVGKTRIAAIPTSIKTASPTTNRKNMVESLIKVFRAGGYEILVENNLANLLDIAWLFGRPTPDHKALRGFNIGSSSTCTPIFYARYLALSRPDANSVTKPGHKDLEPIRKVYENHSTHSILLDPLEKFDKKDAFDAMFDLEPYQSTAWDALTVDTKTAIVELVLQLYFNTHPSKMIATRPLCHLPFSQHLRKRLKDFRTIVVAKILETHEGGDPSQANESGISLDPGLQVVSSMSESSAGSIPESFKAAEPVISPPSFPEGERRDIPTPIKVSGKAPYLPPPMVKSHPPPLDTSLKTRPGFGYQNLDTAYRPEGEPSLAQHGGSLAQSYQPFDQLGASEDFQHPIDSGASPPPRVIPYERSMASHASMDEPQTDYQFHFNFSDDQPGDTKEGLSDPNVDFLMS